MNVVDVARWVVTAVLVLVFGVSAAVQGTQSRERVLGLVVPYARGVAVILTPPAAVGLEVIMCSRRGFTVDWESGHGWPGRGAAVAQPIPTSHR